MKIITISAILLTLYYCYSVVSFLYSLYFPPISTNGISPLVKPNTPLTFSASFNNTTFNSTQLIFTPSTHSLSLYIPSYAPTLLNQHITITLTTNQITLSKSIRLFELISATNSTRHLLQQTTQQSTETLEQLLPHYRSEFQVYLVYDTNTYSSLPIDIIPFTQIRKSKYAPILYINENWRRTTDYSLITFNSTLPTTIHLHLTSLGWFRSTLHLSSSLLSMKHSFASSDTELDNLRELFFQTQPWLLICTFIASILHLLFDFLAFKSDVGHWRGKTSMAGVSRIGLVLSCISQIVVFFYLRDRKEETNVLVGLSCLFSVLVELWKCFIAFKLEMEYKRIGGWISIPWLKSGSVVSVEEQKTRELDFIAFRYLSIVLIPLTVLYSLYSLVFLQHKSFYSYALDSLVAFVYVVGFVTMTPQLFLNYKRKSVDAMPVDVFLYRALNTFVDDLFAFVITMPTMTRLSAFRDDIVFFVLLYQWWIYPKREKIKSE